MKQSKVLSFFQAIVKPRFQVLAIIITTSLVIFFAYQASYEMRVFEPGPQLLSVTPDKVKKWGSEPVPIKVGLHIIDLPKFELITSQFFVDGIVWFEFDPEQISLETISKFSFEKGEIKKISAPNTRLVGNKLFAEYKVKLELMSDLSHQFFPLDDHRLFITLINTYVTPRETIFIESREAFTLSPGIFTVGWKIIDYGMRTGYAKAILDQYDETKVVRYPKAIFFIDFRREGIRQVLLILLPLFLIFFIGLFSFAFDPKVDARQIITLASGSVTSMIAYRFVIQRMSPEAGYFMLSDHIFMIFLVFAFLEFILGILIVNKGELTPFMIVVRGLTFIMFHVSFLIIWYYLLFSWT